MFPQCASRRGPRWRCSTGSAPRRSARAISTWRAATSTPAPSSGAPFTSTCVSLEPEPCRGPRAIRRAADSFFSALCVSSGRRGVRRRRVHRERRLHPLRPDGQAGLLRHRHGAAPTGNGTHAILEIRKSDSMATFSSNPRLSSSPPPSDHP